MKNLTAKEFFSLEAFAHSDLWKEASFVWEALSCIDAYLQRFSFTKTRDKSPPGVVIDSPEKVYMGEGVILEPGVYIQGPCILGTGCVVRHGAYLRGGVICGNRCVIGHASEIKHSIFLDGAQVGHLVYVGDSVLGNKVNLGAGVKCANLRLDRQEIQIRFDGNEQRSGLRKLGAIIGDGCQIGCNSVTNPGTLIGPESVAYPLVNLFGVIPSRTRIRQKDVSLELLPREEAGLNRLVR